MITTMRSVDGPAEPALIDVDELTGLLGASPPDHPAGLVLLDVRWNLGGPPGRPEYEAGHLPGARFVDLETELSATPTGPGGRHPLPEPADFEAAMRRAGVGPDSMVVAYDAANALAAARLWWLLTDAGHPRVRVLDGGYAAWAAAGGPVETGAGEPVAPGAFVGRPGRRRVWSAGEILAADGLRLVDVRGYERFTGEVEPVDPVAGHVPGAVSAPSMENLEPDGRFRPAEQIAARYAGLDAGTDGRSDGAAEQDGPVFYCGSGITAAHTLLARASAGLGGSIYPGSWSDWISDRDRPRETGDGERY